MNRAFLRWFYVGVQFIMLAVSIPKVATLFHAYDKATMGPLIAGVDLRSWLVGIAIDLTATFTTWAAMAKYDESRKRLSLIAPAVIILFCSALSVVANYEDAATQRPEQYANVSLFTQAALLINPLLISAPPVLVLLLILLVPSVLAQPRVKTAAEIEAEADEQEARIAASARIIKAKANARLEVMGTTLRGVMNAVTTATKQEPAQESTMVTQEPVQALEVLEEPAPTATMTKAMWQAMKLPERVQQSGVITPQEIAEVLDISLTHARNLAKEVDGGRQTVQGRSGVSAGDLIDALYDRRTKDSYTWARKLESVLGVRKRARQFQVVPSDELVESIE